LEDTAPALKPTKSYHEAPARGVAFYSVDHEAIGYLLHAIAGNQKRPIPGTSDPALVQYWHPLSEETAQVDHCPRRDINDPSRWFHRRESRGGAKTDVPSNAKLYPD
jgi:hypothetical protein